MAKKLNFKGLTIEEIYEILKDGVDISICEASDIMKASDIMGAIEEDVFLKKGVFLKKKDGFMSSSMWTIAMGILKGLIEFEEDADGNINTKDVLYVEYNKSQKSEADEKRSNVSKVKDDIIKLVKKGRKLANIEEPTREGKITKKVEFEDAKNDIDLLIDSEETIKTEIEDAKREADRLRKKVERKRKFIEGLTDEGKIAKEEKELKKLEKQLTTARNNVNKVSTKLDALKNVNSELKYKNNRLASLKEGVENAKNKTDEAVRNIEKLKYDTYDSFTLKRKEYSEGLKKDLSKINSNISRKTEDIKNIDFKLEHKTNKDEIVKLTEKRDKLTKEIENLKSKKSRLLEDKANEITIYEDTYRVTKQSTSKSRVNDSIFIRDEIVNTKTGEKVRQGALEKLESKMSMGLSDIYNKNPKKEIPAVEYEAYVTLTQSSIVDGFVEIKGDNILVVKDVKAKVKTKAVVGTQSEDAKDILLERVDDYVDENVLWDGMSLLDKSLFRKDRDMILLRQNFFKSAGFKCNLQDYIKSQCEVLGLDYENDYVTDAYGRKVKIADIKMITTDNSTKFDKFAEEMFGEVKDAKKKMFEHWVNLLDKDWDNLFAIVKYDKSTKFKNGELVRASYQMFNSLPFGTDRKAIEESMKKILKVTEDYVEELKTNATAFRDYLEKVAKSNEKAKWLIQLMEANADVINTKQFKDERNAICNKILADAKAGHLLVEGNNLTLCSNPVELVKYALGSPDIVVKDGVLDKLASKNSFGKDRDVINIYTTRFKEGEELVFMRSPHSSASGICVGKNVKNDEIGELFGDELGENVMILDSTNHASQSMLNGAK